LVGKPKETTKKRTKVKETTQDSLDPSAKKKRRECCSTNKWVRLLLADNKVVAVEMDDVLVTMLMERIKAAGAITY
jgi:hypothetical protein